MKNTKKDFSESLERIARGADITLGQHKGAEDTYKEVAEFIEENISSFFEEEDFTVREGFLSNMFPQGSMAIGTAVSPLGRKGEFDLDIVVLLHRKSSDYSPSKALDAIYKMLKERYAKILTKNSRSMSLKYEDRKFKLDIVPACENERTKDRSPIDIPDKSSIEKKITTDPKGYERWFKGISEDVESKLWKQAFLEKSAIEDLPKYASRTLLQRMVQLFKIARNAHFEDKMNLAPTSIILTTLVAKHLKGLIETEHEDSSRYEKVNLAFLFGYVIERLHIKFQQANGPFPIPHPTNAGENLADSWQEEPELFKACKEFISSVHEKWNSGDEKFFMLTTIFGSYYKPKDSGSISNVHLGALSVPSVRSEPTLGKVKPHNFYGGEAE